MYLAQIRFIKVLTKPKQTIIYDIFRCLLDEVRRAVLRVHLLPVLGQRPQLLHVIRVVAATRPPSAAAILVAAARVGRQGDDVGHGVVAHERDGRRRGVLGWLRRAVVIACSRCFSIQHWIRCRRKHETRLRPISHNRRPQWRHCSIRCSEIPLPSWSGTRDSRRHNGLRKKLEAELTAVSLRVTYARSQEGEGARIGCRRASRQAQLACYQPPMLQKKAETSPPPRGLLAGRT